MANEVSFSGLGSGIDFGTIRDAIIAQRSRPINLMQSKVNQYTGRIDALKQFNTTLASVTSSIQALMNRELGNARNATTTDATVATAAAASTAALGGFDLNVSRIATPLTQASRSYPSTTSTVLASGTTATFELRKGGAATSEIKIEIDETTTLAGLRDAINAKNTGVTAAIVDIDGTGTQQQLVLTSKETGTAGRVELVETTTTGTGASLNLRSLNPPDGDTTKLDAEFSINGLTVSRSSNTVSDAVAGVTVTLKKAGAAGIAVNQSTDIENKLRGFVTAYNQVQELVAGHYKKDANDRPVGILAGDATLRAVQQQLREIATSGAPANGGIFETLADIGITAKDNGQLEFDPSMLNEKLKSNPEDVKALLFGKTSSDKGIFNAAFEISNSISDAVKGTVQSSISNYQTSVKSLNETISRRLEGLNSLRDSLTRRFAAADAAIGQLNRQGTALTSIIKSLEPKNNS